MADTAKRFSRMAYARRAAELAEDLEFWQREYHSRVMSNGDLGMWEADAWLIADRDRVLKEAAQELRNISVRLAAMR